MGSITTPAFLDQRGHPFSARIQEALREIRPRLQNRFPALADELRTTDVLEEAGRRITDRETHVGPVENIDAYAWVTAVNIARSAMRRSSMRLARATLRSEESHAVINTLRSTCGTAEQIETEILLQEVMAQLTAEERLLCVRKQLGFSSREIAREQGTSVARVDTLFYRIKRKIRTALRGPTADMSPAGTAHPDETRTA
jgi:RNA polymerase sigma factor (sigma-70 family)